MENLTDDQLLDFLDGTGHETEKEEIKNAVIASDVVKRRMQALEAVHRYLKRQHGLESPSKNFTEKVMAGLHSKTSFAFLSPKNGLLLLLGLGTRVALTGGALLIVLLTFGTALRQDWAIAGIQLNYAALLAFLHWDRYSLDAMLSRNRKEE